MSAAAVYLWYVVVAGPQGGLIALPSPFDQQDQCLAAIKAYEATKPQAGWIMQCIPAGPPLGDEEVPEDGAPAEQQ
ncbi:hypothetical protein G5V57_02495 [Nordella sp. HKS 07]|uniref:hypothetical protein n=1 Tax=Nordella sp. HKS 07 TaxID=2712222 RepID=UPI0013E1880A|nr:hypothetical protein [Nordella sp. HKS 07]QIG46723.1 hypothetical protein G5V57_02495 [Nordella sp. HKS 07]